MKSKKQATPAATDTQGVLELPYATIESNKIASRDHVREMNKSGKTAYGRQTYYIELGIITPRLGFNGRIKPDGMSEDEYDEYLEIPAFAMSLLETGIDTPLEGDLVVEGKKNVFYLTRGERRWRSLRWLVKNGHKKFSNGKDLKMVEVIMNPRDITEEQRIKLMLTSDTNKKYHPLEWGRAFLRLKTTFGKTHDQLHKEYGMSRQTVDNYVKLANEPQLIQQAILTNKLTTTAAIELINKEKDPTKRESYVSEAILGNKSLKVKDVAEVNKYANYAEEFASIVERFNDGIISHEGACQMAREYRAKANEALPARQPDIDTFLVNTLEVLDNNNRIKLAERMEEHAGMVGLTGGEKEKKDEDDMSHLDERNPQPYDDRFSEIIVEFADGKLDYQTAQDTIHNYAHSCYTEYGQNFVIDIDTRKHKALTAILQLKQVKDKGKVKKIETKQADQVEAEHRQTSASYKEPSRAAGQKDDALAPIDFTKDKEAGEFELNEILKLLDKAETKVNLFPDNLKQYKDDVNGLLNLCKMKIPAVIDIIKKAANER